MCIDLFVLSQAYTDTATLSTLSHTTGGSLYHYCPFTPLMDQDQLLNDLKWNVSRPQVGNIGATRTLVCCTHFSSCTGPLDLTVGRRFRYLRAALG